MMFNTQQPADAGGVWSVAVKRTTITALGRDVHRLLEAVGRQLPAPARAGELRSVWCGAAPGWDQAADRGYKARLHVRGGLAGPGEGKRGPRSIRCRHFTWHAVLSSGAVALPAAQATAK